jgi:hypothetical protein
MLVLQILTLLLQGWERKEGLANRSSEKERRRETRQDRLLGPRDRGPLELCHLCAARKKKTLAHTRRTRACSGRMHTTNDFDRRYETTTEISVYISFLSRASPDSAIREDNPRKPREHLNVINAFFET